MTETGNEKSDTGADRLSLTMLVLASFVGVLLGCLSATGWFGKERVPHTVAARVNGADIQMVEYQRALRLFASEKREPVIDKDRSLVLERMIEEQLLLQHGVNSGLVRRNSSVRQEVLKSMLTGLVVDMEAGDQSAQNEAYARGVVRETGSKELESLGEKTNDTTLVDYLGQLKATSTIRWVDAGPP